MMIDWDPKVGLVQLLFSKGSIGEQGWKLKHQQGFVGSGAGIRKVLRNGHNSFITRAPKKPFLKTRFDSSGFQEAFGVFPEKV